MKSSLNNSLAKTYAKAIYLRAVACNNWALWEHFLEAARLVAQHPTLSQHLDQPGIPALTQVKWCVQLCEVVLFEEGQNLLQLLATRKRLRLLPRIAKCFIQFRLKYENTLSVEVYSAVALLPEERQQLETRLVNKLHTKIKLIEQVQPACLGGILVKIGDEVMDATLRARLNQLRAILPAGPIS